MKRLYVGCRVRIVGCDKHSGAKRLVGLSCRITKPAKNAVGWDMWGVDADDGRWCFLEEELEPILYDGNQLVSWSECAWRPEGVSA